MFEQRAQENGEKESSKEAEPEAKMEGRLEDGSVAQIAPEFAGTEDPVKLEFRKAPGVGTLLYLEKPQEVTAEGGGKGFRKFYSAENPIPSVKKQEETVYLRAVPVNPEELETRRAEAVDMREYLTDGTLEQLDLSQPEGEALPIAA